jgi:hypothetical protein
MWCQCTFFLWWLLVVVWSGCHFDNALFSCGGCWLSFGPVVIFRGFEKTSSVGRVMFECQPFNTMDAIRDDLERGMNIVIGK